MQLKTDKMIAQVEGGIGWMTFNNPARRNALSLEMQEAVPEILEAFQRDETVRALVMKGAGEEAFVSGADISEFKTQRTDPGAIERFDTIARRSNEAFEAFEKPFIAKIRGFCMGGGLLTALHADLRIAAEDAQFAVPAVRLGVGYGYGGVKALTDVVGLAAAQEILLTGRRFPAADAFRWGLVNRVVPVADLEPTVRQLGETIAANAPLTTTALRFALRQTRRDPERRDRAEMARRVAACFASEDYREGQRAFLEKRRPAFQGR